MNFEDWYDSLPPQLQRYVEIFAFYPTERNQSFITGYIKAAQDYEHLSPGSLSFWFKCSNRVMEGIEPIKEYFE